MRSGYSVTVTKNGEAIVTIGPDLSGVDCLSDEDADAIREAGESLIAFIGPPGPHACFACGNVGGHEAECPLAR